MLVGFAGFSEVISDMAQNIVSVKEVSERRGWVVGYSYPLGTISQKSGHMVPIPHYKEKEISSGSHEHMEGVAHPY